MKLPKKIKDIAKATGVLAVVLIPGAIPALLIYLQLKKRGDKTNE